jgi:hypothetical protein
MTFQPGDHACVLYSSTRELATTVGRFLAVGLGRGERAWYVASGAEDRAVRSALRTEGVDVDAAISRGALRLIRAHDAYLIHGRFDPESTVRVFNDAIEESFAAGFTGFRAAAEMSWALEPDDGLDRLITYEALLRTLFANCRAIGLCLYHRRRMPLAVIDGALATHPIAGVAIKGTFCQNPFYDPGASTLNAVASDRIVRRKLRAVVGKA